MDTFKLDIYFSQEDQISVARKTDRSLMLEFHQLGFQGNKLEALNIVQCYCNLIHVLDILKSNGNLLDKFMVWDLSENMVQHIFPYEELTSSDF